MDVQNVDERILPSLLHKQEIVDVHNKLNRAFANYFRYTSSGHATSYRHEYVQYLMNMYCLISDIKEFDDKKYSPLKTFLEKAISNDQRTIRLMEDDKKLALIYRSLREILYKSGILKLELDKETPLDAFKKGFR